MKLKWIVFFQRLVPFFGYHHVLMTFLCIPIILSSIMLAGCSSYSSMTNIYVLGFSYINSTPSDLSPIGRNLSQTLSGMKGSAQLEVRTGYFGMCVRQRGIVWLCSSDANGLAQQFGPDNDPLDLIGTAARFKDDVIFSGLLIMSVILALFSTLLMATFPGWHVEHDERTGSDVDVKPFPSRPVSHVALSCAAVAAMLSLVATVWQHVGAVAAAAMAETASFGNVKSSIGAGSMAMAWTSFSFTIIAAIGLLVMVLSIRLLDRLTD